MRAVLLRPQSLLAVLLLVALAGCASRQHDTAVFARESFAVSSVHARGYPVTPVEACEAARRSLLSHGYVVSRASDSVVEARKSFQPIADSHVEIIFNVVCAEETEARSTVYVNAVQDRYALKKTSTSASLGVGPVGSVSLPFGSSNDSMVKVASETIVAPTFYERYFMLIEHVLARREFDIESLPADPPDLTPPGTPGRS